MPFLRPKFASGLNNCLDYQSHRISDFKLRNGLQENAISCFEKNFIYFKGLEPRTITPLSYSNVDVVSAFKSAFN